LRSPKETCWRILAWMRASRFGRVCLRQLGDPSNYRQTTGVDPLQLCVAGPGTEGLREQRAFWKRGAKAQVRPLAGLKDRPYERAQTARKRP
jgi:hypothetical protein